MPADHPPLDVPTHARTTHNRQPHDRQPHNRQPHDHRTLPARAAGLIGARPPRRIRPWPAFPSGLTGLAGLACAACCALPVLLAAGVLSGAGWVAAGQWLPGVSVALIALSGAAWWWSGHRRHRRGCAGGDACGCARPQRDARPQQGA